jgi:hypothetical protein
MVALPLEVKNTIERRAAGVHQFSHPLFGQLLFLHLGSELMRDNGLDGGNRHLLPDAHLIQPAFQTRSDMRVLLFGHDTICFSLCRAIALESCLRWRRERMLTFGIYRQRRYRDQRRDSA